MTLFLNGITASCMHFFHLHLIVFGTDKAYLAAKERKRKQILGYNYQSLAQW
jgi:hypothetical protein